MSVIRIHMVCRLNPLAGSKDSTNNRLQTFANRGFAACRFQALPYCLFPLSPAVRLDFCLSCFCIESSWNVMAHGDAREGKWRGNWRMEWVASTLHTSSEHGVSSITTADAHTSPASSLLKWRSRRFKWALPFRRKTKSGFCACAIAFQTQSTHVNGRLFPH